MTPDAEAARRMRLILELRQIGVTDARLLAAIELTNRALFAPLHMEALAWDDLALPIECGQTLTKPSLIAQHLLALELRPLDRVLEIGGGTGYQTAILARLATRVTSVERHKELARAAHDRLAALGVANARMHWADGADGWAPDGPFDRVIVNAAAPDFLPVVLNQMAAGGVLVAPIGEGEQRLKRVRKDADGGFTVEDLGVARMGPLGDGIAG
jgi:protein-L-isoaspartate(D-aspartate) O-methyltransferase